jgi:hypothetical protein
MICFTMISYISGSRRKPKVGCLYAVGSDQVKLFENQLVDFNQIKVSLLKP